MTADQQALVADVLADFQEVGDVPDGFAAFVQEKIAARPSPTLQAIEAPDPLDEVNRKLDEVLALLRGTTE